MNLFGEEGYPAKGIMMFKSVYEEKKEEV